MLKLVVYSVMSAPSWALHQRLRYTMWFLSDELAGYLSHFQNQSTWKLRRHRPCQHM